MFSSYFHQRFFVAAAFFVAAGLAALLWEQPIILILPFFWLLLPFVAKIAIYKTEWLYYLLFALLPLSAEVNISPSLGFDFPDELLMVGLSGLFILKIIHKPSMFPKVVIKHPLMLLLVLHLAWLLVACFYSVDVWLSVKFVLAKTWFIVPFVIMPAIYLNNKKSVRLVALLLLIPMGFVVLQSLVRHAFYGFSFEGIKETLGPFFRNHVAYSSMLVCLLAMLWAMYILTPAASQYKRLLKAGLMLGIVAVVLSYSRGAWLALLMGFIAAWAIKRNWLGWLVGIAAFILICTASWLLTNKRYLQFAPDYNTTIFHHDFGEHLRATVSLQDVSNAERFYRWAAAANMVAEKPLTGFGPNNFYNSYKPYTIAPFKTWVSNNPDHSSVHNYFLLTLLEQGFPGLAFFTLLYVGMLLKAQKRYHRLHDPFYKTIALTVGVILVMIGSIIFMSDLVETDKTGSLFWLCLGMLVVLDEKEVQERTGAI